MNKQRRAALDQIRDELEALKSRIEDLRGEEEDYYDSMPEGFQNGEKGEKARDVIGSMENAEQGIDEAIDAINEAIGA